VAITTARVLETALEMAFAVTGSILDFLEQVDLAVAPLGEVQVVFSPGSQ
jgi:hypothetical protein